MSRNYSFNRKVRTSDKGEINKRSKVGKIDETRITEVLDALVKSGLVIQTKSQYHLAPEVKNEKIEKMLIEINAKLARMRQMQEKTKAHRLPFYRLARYDSQVHHLPPLR